MLDDREVEPAPSCPRVTDSSAKLSHEQQMSHSQEALFNTDKVPLTLGHGDEEVLSSVSG